MAVTELVNLTLIIEINETSFLDSIEHRVACFLHYSQCYVVMILLICLCIHGEIYLTKMPN